LRQSMQLPDEEGRRAHDQDDEDEFCELHWSSICSISRIAEP
jgi:hypothetical protein